MQECTPTPNLRQLLTVNFVPQNILSAMSRKQGGETHGHTDMPSKPSQVTLPTRDCASWQRAHTLSLALDDILSSMYIISHIAVHHQERMYITCCLHAKIASTYNVHVHPSLQVIHAFTSTPTQP